MISLNLDPVNSNSHFDLIRDTLIERIGIVIKKNCIRKKVKGKFTDVLLEKDLKYILKKLTNSNLLANLIKATPDDIKRYISIVKKRYPSFLTKNHSSSIILYNIFVSHGYDIGFSKLEFIEKIGKDTCIYCNRNYIYSLKKRDKIKPQIDHFYPKSKYPFLAVSFYNLIPACQTCNGIEVKGEKDPLHPLSELTNPYSLKGDEFKFGYTIKSIDVLNKISNTRSININFKKSLQGHLNIFKLDKLYNLHSDHILELIIKSQLEYTTSYRDFLKQFEGLNLSDSEIDRLIIGNYSNDEDLHKRPLSKMYADIGRELGLIK